MEGKDFGDGVCAFQEEEVESQEGIRTQQMLPLSWEFFPKVRLLQKAREVNREGNRHSQVGCWNDSGSVKALKKKTNGLRFDQRNRFKNQTLTPAKKQPSWCHMFPVGWRPRCSQSLQSIRWIDFGFGDPFASHKMCSILAYTFANICFFEHIFSHFVCLVTIRTWIFRTLT